jgi:hypothetical protein
MSDAPATSAPGHGRPQRAGKPERIDIGTDELIRNDILAGEHGVSERTLNRGDAKGAPYILIGGVKYRPRRGYREFIAGIVRRVPMPKRRRVAGGTDPRRIGKAA